MSSKSQRRSGEMKGFPLRVLSAYSLYRAAVMPDHWVRLAATAGYGAILQADWGNLYGALPFLTEARDQGIKAALGAILPLTANIPPGEAIDKKTVLLICEDITGYRNLCHIISCSGGLGGTQLTETFDLWQVLRENRRGLFCLTSDVDLLEPLQTVTEKGYNAALLPWLAGSTVAAGSLRQTARQLGLPLMALPLANMLSESQHTTMRVLTAVGRRDFLPENHPGASALPGLEILRSFAQQNSAALQAGLRLLTRCRLSAADLMPKKFIFPKLSDDSNSLLRRRCEGGLHRFNLASSAEAWSRLNNELTVIKQLGFADYFLATSRVTSWSRCQGIAIAGRGSGVASLVAYLLGITNVDPIRYHLYFERFLHAQRKDYPDIDIDVAWNRRDEVIDYMLRVFGRTRAAMICTHQFFRPRGAWRAAARTLGMDDAEIKRASRFLPRFFSGEPELKLSDEGNDSKSADQAALAVLSRISGKGDNRAREAAQLAIGISGLPCGVGIHVGGVVLADRRLSCLVPLERSANGVVITQFEMKAIERIGLIKIDILGNRALGTIAEVSAQSDSPQAGEPVPQDDRATGELISSGATLGCFQLESPAMRTLQKQLQTRDLAGVIAAIALIRPGPSSSGMKGRYIKRELGVEETEAIHSEVATLLGETHGLPLYEEDIMCLASAVTGLDYAGGDMLRRAIGEAAAGQPRGVPKAENEAMKRIRDGFFKLAWRQGKPTAAEPVWEQLIRFASYSFCKAHAAGFGQLAFQTAYLKAHYPGAFMTALLNHHRGMYPLRVYVDEARRLGIIVRPPSVWESERLWQWVSSKGIIRCPLTRVKGIRDDTVTRIIEVREQAPFRSLADFVFRIRPTSLELEALLLCGAFDEQLPQPRGKLLWEAQRLLRSRQGAIAGAHLERSGQQTLTLPWPASCGPGKTAETGGVAKVGKTGGAGKTGSAKGKNIWRDISRSHRARLERCWLGLAISMHPAEIWHEKNETPDVSESDRVCIGKLLTGGAGLVKVSGIVSAQRSFTGKDGTPCRFFTLEDESGLLECTMRGKALLRENGFVSVDDIVEVSGRVIEVFSARGLRVISVRIKGKH